MKTLNIPTVHPNPVYAGYLADPFVWKHGDVYYAIGTGEAEATGHTLGKVFPVLHSTDFVQWQFASNALVRPDPELGNNFWAPAVACAEGKFYLYYSVGHEDKCHRLRVAVSDEPLGPYTDVKRPLVDPRSCPFAIDPHPFRDDDGQWYLFYARDFLDCSEDVRAGTALEMDRLKTMTQLAGEAKPVLRARHDWQRFQSPRSMYGKTFDWHTLEGPCLWKHSGRYYCFYSGGRWETDSYGVDYGVAEHLAGPYSDEGNEGGPRVLHTVAGKLTGPGHNSIVIGPDDETEYIVYHAWDRERKVRQMHIDRLTWTDEGPVCEPSYLHAGC
jgi:beta-xylosidase